MRYSFYIFVFFIILGKSLFSQSFDDVGHKIDLEQYSYQDTQSVVHGYIFGCGVSFFDFNNDGRDDISLPVGNDSVAMFLNTKKGFIDTNIISLKPGIGRVRQIHWVDIDNDGDNDLYLSIFNGSNKLYRNKGNFNFKDVSDSSGLDTLTNYSMGTSFGDFNRDGYLDFYVCNYYNDSTNWIGDRYHNQLYQNNGDGTFTNVTQKAGVGDKAKPSFQGVWFDYNKDDLPDLFVINDLHSYGNRLYQNLGNGRFKDVASSVNAELHGNHPMTATVGDFQNDGFFDIFMSNTSMDFLGLKRNGLLLVGDSSFRFKERGKEYGVNLKIWSWGATWVDYDNDAFSDLYVTTAEVSKPFKNAPNRFYINKRDTFLNGADVFVDSHNARSYSVAKGDLNNDGYYDLLVQGNKVKDASLVSSPFLWENSGQSNSYIKITLQGTASNRMAIGSWIRVYVDGHKYMKYTKSGQNYLSQNSQHKIFGLDTFSKVDSVVVKYLSGHTDRYYNLKANKHYYFKEGETKEINFDSSQILCRGDTLELDAGKYDSLRWNTGDTTQRIKVTDSGKYFVVGKTENGVLIKSDTVNVKFKPKISYQVDHVNCFGNESGRIQLNIDSVGDLSPFKIEWNSLEEKGLSVDSLNAGYYQYAYQDSSGCQFTDSLKIKEPSALHLNTSVNYNSFTEKGTGNIELNINGGTPPYKSSLNDTIETRPFDNLQSGTYFLKVKDDNGCLAYDTIEILEAQTPTINAKVEPVSCSGSGDGSIKLVVDSTGDKDFSISWKNGMTGTELKRLEKGEYVYIYNDQVGITYKDTVHVHALSQMVINTSVLDVDSGSLGSIKINVKEGIAPYKIFLNGIEVGKEIDSLKAGQYQLTIQDSLGCSKTKTVEIEDKRLPEFNYKKDNVSCYGASDGSVLLEVDTTHNIGFSIMWEDGTNGLKRQGLDAGTYTFNYADNRGVTFTDSIRIKEPEPLGFEKVVTRNDDSSGCDTKIDIKGGKKPYDIAWDGVKKESPITDLQNGEHRLNVKDANGCRLDTGVMIRNLDIPDIDFSTVEPDCHDSHNGSIKLQIAEDNEGVQIFWSNGKTGKTIDGVGEGTYKFTYQLPSGCRYKDSLQLRAPFPINIQKMVEHSQENHFGKIRIIVNGGVAPYQIFLNEREQGTYRQDWSEMALDSVSPGQHTLKVQDANDCKEKTQVTVDSSTNLSANLKNENGQVNLWPNPVKKGEEILLEGSNLEGSMEYKVYNMIGQVVKSGKLKKSSSIKTDQLAAGNYTLFLRHNNSISHQRVVITQ